MLSLLGLVTALRTDYLKDDAATSEQTAKWKTPGIVFALNEAEREFARRTLFISDSMTASLCQLSITDSHGNIQQHLPLSSKIVRVRFVRFPSADGTRYRTLIRSSCERLNIQDAWGWLDKPGHIERFVTDYQKNYLSFEYVPDHGGTVKIGTYRLPLSDMIWDTSPTSKATPDLVFPEIQEHDMALMAGALKYLYYKDDAETYDPVRGKNWEGIFEKLINDVVDEQAAMEPKETIVRAEVW